MPISIRTKRETIVSYKVNLFAKPQNDLLAIISCVDDKGQAVVCEFYKNGTDLPDNRYHEKLFHFSYHWMHLARVLNVLRNENPVYYYVNFDQSAGESVIHSCGIESGRVPVGEGEDN